MVGLDFFLARLAVLVGVYRVKIFRDSGQALVGFIAANNAVFVSVRLAEFLIGPLFTLLFAILLAILLVSVPMLP